MIPESGESISLSEEIERVFPEEYFQYEPESPDELFAFIDKIITELIERVIPVEKRELTLEKAGQCLSLLGKIWNLTECHEGCEIDSIKCQTSDEKLLDMEGYVEEYQYLHLQAVDMQLSDVRVIPEHFIWLLSVDLSGNLLTNISALPLTKLQNLVSLKLNRNRIVDPYLHPMKHLQYLGMNTNEIESLHRVYHPNLTTLDVNWNAITRIDPADNWKLRRLQKLELRGNRLKRMMGIEYENLAELYLADNGITKLTGVERLTKLRRLHLRKNPISDLTGFTSENRCLEYLNVRSCQIADAEELRKLQILEGLSVLVVKDNLFNPSPEIEDNEEADVAGGDDDDDLRIQILMILPQLKRINKKTVTWEERKTARNTLEEVELG